MKSGLMLVAGLALLGACGDDSSGTPDARPIDAAPDAPPVDFFSNEGGEVRFEYIYVGAITGNMGDTITRVMAFFEKKDDVDNHMYPTIPGCTLVTDDTKWPTSQPMNRQYADVGTLTLTNGTKTLVVPKSTGTTDPVGRAHGANNWYSHSVLESTPGAMLNDGPTYVSEKSSYDVKFGGSGTWPAMEYKNAIYFPADYQLVSPAYGAPVNLVAGTPYTQTWNVVDSMRPAGVPDAWALIGFFELVNGQTNAIVVCVENMNDGSMTVPANMVDMIRTAAPGGGVLVRQVFHHQVRELTNGADVKGRRIDMIGVWCWASGFGVQ